MVNSWFSSLALLVLALVLASCDRNDIKVYRVAKEAPQTPAAQEPTAPAAPSEPDTVAARPRLQWKLPEGWKEVPPSEMRLASFSVAGKDGKQADVSIVPLGGMAGGDLLNVNRWRGMVGLPAVQEDEFSKMGQDVVAGGQPAKLYDMAGENAASGDKSRILAAVQRREGTSWFFKMSGDDQFVEQQKPAFIEFLKSLTFAEGGSDSSAAAMPNLPPSHPPIDSAALTTASSGAVTASPDRPEWKVPAGWKETSGQFLVAKFLVTGSDNARAAVNVSITGGGVGANVNRWRGQLGLAPLSEDDLTKQMKPLASGTEAKLIDLSGTEATTGQKARLIGVIVPQADRTWYYKLMGNPQLVAQERSAFLKFVQSAKYK
ncbi:MAG: hypothetical protein C5B50_27880 [Verrucomicrobia bacterium]|nr:MAG: hypothetical protein C5B50_27880 [Verrucomicrobiota bacterium]